MIKPLELSIVIPVLNEADGIASLLEHLDSSLASPATCELIIVDGGSTDGTQKIVTEFTARNPRTAVNQIDTSKGRALQMNTGARTAKSDLLYFLHADSFPPYHFDKLIVGQVNEGNPAGCFRLQFDSNHWWLQMAGWFTKFNWKVCRGGDQSLFIKKELFNTVGGFNEAYRICEDNVLIRRLYKSANFVVIPESITTSARLYHKKGIWRLQYHFLVIYFKKRMGASPDALYNYYRKKILSVN